MKYVDEKITTQVEYDALPPGQIIVFEQIRIVRRTWWIVLVSAFLVTAAVWYYVTHMVEPEYVASVMAVPPRKASTPLDNLLGDVASGLKSMSVARLLGGKSDNSGYSTFAILNSEPVKDSLIAKYRLHDRYGIDPERRDIVLGILAGKMEFESDLEGPITVNVYDRDPEIAAEMANDAIYFANALLTDLNRKETEPITRYIATRYRDLQREQQELSAKLEGYMKQNSIIDPEAQLPAIASGLIEARATEASYRITLEMLEQSLGADDPAVIKARSLLAAATAERKRMEAGGNGLGPSVSSMPTAMIEYTRLRQDYEVNAQLLAVIEPMYQQTVFDETRDIPQLLVVNPAYPPFDPVRPRKMISIVSAFAGTILLGYLVIALMAYARSFSTRYREWTGSVEQSEVRRTISEVSSTRP